MQNNLFATGAKEDFFKALKDGEAIDCPCCGRYAQQYRRRITSAIARCMIGLYNAGGHSDFVNYKKFFSIGNGGDFCITRYFGLAEMKPRDSKEKRSSGFWRLTQKGIDFVECKTTIPEIAVVFDNRVLELTGQQVNIRQSLKNKFDYQQLINERN